MIETIMIIMLLLFLVFVYLSVILIYLYKKYHKPKLEEKLGKRKLRIRTWIRNVGMLFLLPANFYLLSYAFMSSEILKYYPLWFQCLYLWFPILGVSCLTLNIVLWLATKIEVSNE